MNPRWLLLVIACLAVAGCTSVTPSSTPGVSAIQLRIAPADESCPFAHVGYPELTFRIDPAAGEHVVAVADDGTRYHTWWSEGFEGGSVDDPVVRDPAGQIVARDGEVLVIPGVGQGFPRLHGYKVCASGDSIYVLVSGPA